MPSQREIRADYDAATIVLYQAYAPAVADPALKAQRFVAPFSFNRMTWIKPSFRWLMHRSNWARKPGQERILAVRITRDGWEQALHVHGQWDPERTLRGAALNLYSIQVGIGRTLIRTLAEEWTVELTDLTPTTRKIANLLHSGQATKAQRLLPTEHLYPVPPETARRLGM